jgi:hypothetical protein
MKHIAQTLLLLLLSCSIGMAQETVSATAMGTFSVTSSLTVTKLADLIFGDMLVGVTTTILPTSAQAARFFINGNANSTIQVTITFPTSLTCGSNTMEFSPLTPLYNTSSDALSAIQFLGSSGGIASTGTGGNLYIWVGGKTTATTKQPAGNYTGIIELTVTEQ